MSKIMIIIQARMTSTRLPGKVLLPIGKKPALQIMIERLKEWRENIIIATTNDSSEAPIVACCNTLGIRYFRGDTDNVLARYYQAARTFGAEPEDGIMRLTSDCPLVDYDLCSDIIRTFQTQAYDMVSLGPHSGFPRGLDCCIFRYRVLEETYLQATDARDKEHVTLGMGKFSRLHRHTIHAPEDLSHYRLTMDEQDDYRAISEIYRLFGYQSDFNYKALISLLKNNPYILDINKHVAQKTV